MFGIGQSELLLLIAVLGIFAALPITIVVIVLMVVLRKKKTHD